MKVSQRLDGTNNGVRACSPQDSCPPVHNRIRVEAGGTNDANGNMERDGGDGKEYRQRFQVCLKVVRAVKAYTCTVNLSVNAQVDFIISYQSISFYYMSCAGHPHPLQYMKIEARLFVDKKT